MRQDILYLETSLEGFLVQPEKRRTSLPALSAFVKTLPVHTTVFPVWLHSVEDLKVCFAQCREQNARARASDLGHGVKEPTAIRYIHIDTHGSSSGLYLRTKEGRDASLIEIAEQFSVLKDSGIEAVFFSACGVGRNRELAEELTERGGIPFVVGYFNYAYDGLSALAEQLFYYQVLHHPRLPIRTAVRRVNDAMYVLGEDTNRMLACWERKKNEVTGPMPWWTGELGNSKQDTESRSFLANIDHELGERGPISDETANHIRMLFKSLR
jgi:hypothetical protein